MPSFSIPLTGLQADSTALSNIGNNLANLNTTAFKKQTTTFEDLFYQNIGTSGNNDALQSGVGTKVSGTSSDFSQGTLSTTSNATDMAIQGNGFFVVEANGVQNLTRDGNFSLGAGGDLQTADGQSVLGYPAVGGALNLNAPLTPINIPIGTQETAKPTSYIMQGANLDATAANGTSFSTSLTVYDSLGQSHAATVDYTKTGANTWNYAVALPAGDATGTPVNNTGTLTFDSTGKLVSPAANVTGISFPGMVDGASNLTFQWQLYDASGNPHISQSSGSSAVAMTNQDGFASGLYQGFSVDATGVISAQFDNGHKVAVGQIALASVTNLQGLTRLGGNNYGITSASGEASVGSAGLGGRGTVQDNSLEQSNVDISTEFANLIVAQRAFEANSKTVTTFDTVTQETINIIR